MEIKELAIKYHEIKIKKDAKRRVIDYEHANKLRDLKAQAIDVESNLKVMSFRNDIKNDEEIFDQYNAELKEIESELKPLLKEINANSADVLNTHLYNKIYLGTYLDEEGNIVSNSFHKMG